MTEGQLRRPRALVVAGYDRSMSAVKSQAGFSPDGKRIVTASWDNTARLWGIIANTQELIFHAKAAVPRCLTPAQRKAFFLPPEPPLWCIELENASARHSDSANFPFGAKMQKKGTLLPERTLILQNHTVAHRSSDRPRMKAASPASTNAIARRPRPRADVEAEIPIL